SPDDAARVVQPFLQPLRFRDMSRAASPIDAQSIGGNSEHSVTQSSNVLPSNVPVAPVAESEELQAVLSAMREWMAGSQLRSDDAPRDLLFRLVKHGIDWDNEDVPLKLERDRVKNKN